MCSVKTGKLQTLSQLIIFTELKCFCLAMFLSMWVSVVGLDLASGYSNLLIHPIRGPNFILSLYISHILYVIDGRTINSIFHLKEKYENSQHQLII